MGSLIAAAWIASLAVTEEDTRIPFAPATFSADEGCHWIAAGMDGLRMTEAFIAAPEPGQDRSAWLESMKAYREAARAGSGQPTMRLDFDGVRAWTRLAAPLAKALALEPGDQLEIRVDARAVSGNTTLCVALDILEPVRDTWTSWSSVLATLPIPADGAWHTVSASVAIPPRTVDGAWFRPIVGMDGTHDAARGSVDIRDIQFRVDDPVRMTRLAEAAAALYHPGIDLSIYDRLDLMWASRIFTCHFTFMYDRAFYDPSAGYTVDRFLDDGAREFGGYDAVVLWQAYPRIGVDQRNQFDFYRDMPGGLEGIRGAVRKFHARGVKVFIDYNPWDRGTRSSGKPDEEALAEIVSAIEADGIFLDTMLGGSAELRKAIDAARPGVVFAPEGHPAVEQLGICNESWAQGLQESA
ncbi:MAG: SUMF1/EgtB/PvdO family nonheme iron enzyme, partial [Candidatus Hydrogenedentes bacterium]|nr:SUMF1/EgtB/PvdO family nonheme iron enzyme [Candidatus Hydrogenedentota bacterium]